MGIKNFLLSLLILFGTWLFLNSSVRLDVLIVGACVALLVTLIFSRAPQVVTTLRLNPKALIYLFAYFWVFLFELLKSNIDVATRVISPTLNINPGIVKVKTRLKSKMGRLLLANSITLTPGTLTVEIEDDFLFIHWIDVSSTDVKHASKKIVAGFEKYLEVIYG
jgi:multicomponent Na+:H+ antiporter subunit E